MFNKLTIIGKIGRDPEAKTTSTGKSLCNLSVAVTGDFKDSNGDKPTDWFNVTLWGQQADYISQYAKKGNTVVVDGRMESRTVEKDGQKKTYWTVQANTVKILDQPKGDYKASAPKDEEPDPFGDD